MPPANFGAVPTGTTERMTVSFSFAAATSGITPSVLTQGATGLDFADAGGGSCDANGAIYRYNAGDSCTVEVTFTPQYAGTRSGAVVLSGASGSVATMYIEGTGQGPQLVFPSYQTIHSLGGGYTGLGGIAVDGSGNVYVADNGAVKEIPPGCVWSSCAIVLGGGSALLGPWRWTGAGTSTSRMVRSEWQRCPPAALPPVV